MMPHKKKRTNFSILLVEPKTSGNIGAVARAMMNFDAEQMILVNPLCPLDDICYARAMHAEDILNQAITYPSFAQAIQSFDYVVATSSVQSMNDKRHLRNAVTLQDFTTKIFEVQGNIALVFGREDYGLYNEEIASCDMLVNIPTSTAYPALNLSHSVCIMLYSLYIGQQHDNYPKKREIGPCEKEKLFEFFSLLLDHIEYPAYKKENTKIMFKRLMGRALPSTWEYHTLMGVFSDTLQHIPGYKKQNKD